MSRNNLQKKKSEAIKEKSQYALAFGLIATMLLVAGFPTFVIFFFGIFAYFLWKTFSTPSPGETQGIFEFYLSANEILRDDERRWFGFETQEVIGRGERILQNMSGAPPLVYFTLGALYHKTGDHKSAINHLSYILENEHAEESTYAHPSPELRNYVKILRKIEREPAEAPQTSAAIRALERARRNRGKAMLEDARLKAADLKLQKRANSLEQKRRRAELAEKNDLPENYGAPASVTLEEKTDAAETTMIPETVAPWHFLANEDSPPAPANENNARKPEKSSAAKTGKKKTDEDLFANRKPITEVLHDIYDGK